MLRLPFDLSHGWIRTRFGSGKDELLGPYKKLSVAHLIPKDLIDLFLLDSHSHAFVSFSHRGSSHSSFQRRQVWGIPAASLLGFVSVHIPRQTRHLPVP